MRFEERNWPLIMSNYFKPVLYFFAFWMVLVVGYGLMFAEEYDTDSITVTFRCTSVLSQSEHYPRYVIEECIKLRTSKN